MPIQLYKEKKIEKQKIKYIIGVAAGKGGVGKSTVAVNLALAVHKLGYSVGIMDADVYGPSIRKMLLPNAPPRKKGDVFFIPANCQGIKVMSLAFFREDFEAAAVRAPIANSLITQFISNVEWGELDYLFIDFPPGTGDIQLTLCQKANLTCGIMVTTPQEIALLDVRKAIHLFQQLSIPILGVVENMSYYLHQSGEKIEIFGSGGGEKLAREHGVPLLGTIPIDPFICQCGDSGKNLLEDENSISVSTYMELGKNVIHHVESLVDSSKNFVKDFTLVWREM